MIMQIYTQRQTLRDTMDLRPMMTFDNESVTIILRSSSSVHV